MPKAKRMYCAVCGKEIAIVARHGRWWLRAHGERDFYSLELKICPGTKMPPWPQPDTDGGVR